jgi:hypothetical protein
VKYRNLIQKSPHYSATYWEECRAFYRGGRDLLSNPALLARVFPQHANEAPEIYAERCKRATYLAYAGELLDYIVASLAAEPLSLTSEPKAPAFYQEFANSTDGKALTLNDLIQQQVLTALICKTAWTLVDLPPLDSGAVIESEADEEDVGLLRAFAFPVEPECVYDWDVTPSGDLEWALLCMRSTPRRTLEEDRSLITERYTYYTRDGWERYDVTYKSGKELKPDEDVQLTQSGSHSFGKVPLARLELPDGLWAMDKIHCLCREILNKRSGISFSQLRHLFPILTAYLGPQIGPGDEIPSEAAQDPDRATNQVYGIGRIVKFGDKDKLEYTSPDPGIYETALNDLSGLRDELHRVLHQMALAANNSAAALKRSGESKAQDKAAACVVLQAVGELARRHAVDIHELAAAGRRDRPIEWSVYGMQDFDVEGLAEAVEQAAVVQTLTIPSPTFHQIYRYSVASKAVSGLATPEQLEKIREEIEASTTAEEFDPQRKMELETAAVMGPPEPTADGDESKEKPAKRKQKAGKRQKGAAA